MVSWSYYCIKIWSSEVWMCRWCVNLTSSEGLKFSVLWVWDYLYQQMIWINHTEPQETTHTAATAFITHTTFLKIFDYFISQIITQINLRTWKHKMLWNWKINKVSVCVCVCFCDKRGHTFVRWLMRTLPHVLTFQNAYKSYRVSFFGESRNAQSPVRAKFRYRVGVGQ